MNLKNRLWILKFRFFEKRNIILLIVLSFTFLAILTTLTFFYITNYTTHNELSSPSYLNLHVYVEDQVVSDEIIKEIEDIDHVIYATNLISSRTVFESANQESIVLKPLLDEKEIKIKKGRNLENNLEAICPNEFYPYDFSDTLNPNKYIKGNKVVGKIITINNQTFKIVGTYDAKKIRNSANECYISKNDFKKLPNIIDTQIVTVKVDKTTNQPKVAEEISKLGFKEIERNNNNTNYLLMYTSLLISLVVLIISFTLIYIFIKKKIRYRLTTYGILKVSGYKNKEIFKIDLLENIIVNTICFLISVFIFIIIYTLIINNITIFDEMIYNNEIDLKINYFYILLSYFICVIMMVIATKHLTKKYLNISIHNMIKEE